MRFTLFCYCRPLIFDDQYLKHSKVFCPNVGSQVWRRETERCLSLYFLNDHIHNLPFKIKYITLQIGHQNKSKSSRFYFFMHKSILLYSPNIQNV